MASETAIIRNGLDLGVLNADQQIVSRVKTFVVLTDNTADATNTIDITLANFGATRVLGILGFKETTDGSVIVTENPTSAVSAGVLTLTIPAGTDDDPRTYLVYYI